MGIFSHNVCVYSNLNRELVETVKYPVDEQERRIFCAAIEAATGSEHRFRVGAALWHRGNSAMWQEWNTREQHAEIRLMMAVPPEYRQGGVVAVARLGKRNDWRCSYPCERCLKALRRLGVARVVCLDEYHALVAFNI